MSGYNSSLETLFTKMEGFVSSKTVVGEPINVGGMVILPLVDVTVGVGAGSGGEAGKGGGGLGAKISPTAVIVIQNGTIQLIDVKNKDSVNKLIDMVPGVISGLNFGPFKKGDDDQRVQEVKFEEGIKIEIEPEGGEL